MAYTVRDPSTGYHAPGPALGHGTGSREKGRRELAQRQTHITLQQEAREMLVVFESGRVGAPGWPLAANCEDLACGKYEYI